MSDQAGPQEAAEISEVVPALGASRVLAMLGSSHRGLEDSEVSKRRTAAWPNSLPPARGRSAVVEFATGLATEFGRIYQLTAGLADHRHSGT